MNMKRSIEEYSSYLYWEHIEPHNDCTTMSGKADHTDNDSLSTWKGFYNPIIGANSLVRITEDTINSDLKSYS